ncbi:NAD(P)-dependent oxidoreductase [Agromyces neolithicus]|uniref:D-isomer specific 2-hydroxyacid dehydrogenase family protein n=1 Tax=Agromyces neolithicus TaxID=269420 RepID=A0ABN2M7S1_9MICO
MTHDPNSEPNVRHRAVAGAPGGATPPSTAVEPGPIAILPTPDAVVADAVRRGGGTLAPLSPETRGIVWVAASGADELAAVLDAHPAVSWVQLPWAGVDAFSGVLQTVRDDGRVWTSAKGAYAQPVAEHALTLALALMRVLPRRIRATSWQADEVGRSLYGARVVIVGAGGIALELLRLLRPFDVDATIVRRQHTAVPGAARTLPSTRLGEALDGAAVVFVAAALTHASHRLIGRAELARLAPGAILVNVARGALVDTEALLEALESGRLGGAGLDVTDPEPLPDGHALWSAPDCIITPHVADTDEMTAPLFAERVAVNVRAFLADGDFVGRIDPSVGY